MKIITKKEQIIPGMTGNVYLKTDGSKLISNGIVEKIDQFDETVFLDGKKIWVAENNTLIIFELVSYPERKRISKEWVAQNLDKIPGLKVWNIGSEFDIIKSVNINGLYDDYGVLLHYNMFLYIDPPHPVVEDITPPWEVELKSTPLEYPNYKEQSEPDNTIKRLWWVYNKNSDEIILHSNVACTENEFVDSIKKHRSWVYKYAPGPIAPPESEWREVK